MKKIGLLALALIGFNSCHAETISVRADTWCPYNCTPNSSKPGYMIEIMQQTLGKKGHTIDYQEMNWARAIIATRSGKFNAVVGARKTEVPDFVFPDVALGGDSSCFYVLPKTNWTYSGLTSLDTATVSVVRDYTYDDGEFDQYIKTHQNNTKRIEIISGDDPLTRNISKLASGRITSFIENSTVVQYHQANNKKTTPLTKGACLRDVPIYIAFSPVNPQSKAYAQIVSDGMVELRKSGALKKILAKYGLKDDFN
jgi:polar amino acid transport system substrate-binding protein